MSPGKASLYLRPKQLASSHYGGTVQSRRRGPNKRTKKLEAQSPQHLKQKTKKIVVTREIDTKPVHDPVTPPQTSLDGIRSERSAIRRRASTMDISLSRPSSITATHINGQQFFEDPGWRRRFGSHDAGEVASISLSENGAGLRDCFPPEEALSTQQLSSLATVEHIFDPEHPDKKITPGPPEMPRNSGNPTSEDDNRLSRRPVLSQSKRVGGSTSLLKSRIIAQRVWLVKSVRAPLGCFRAEEPVRKEKHHRFAISKHISLGRKFRSQKRSENMSISSRLEEKTMESRTVFELVDIDAEKPKDPELAATLHNPNQNIFSEEWADFISQKPAGDHGQPPAFIGYSSEDLSAKRPILENPTESEAALKPHMKKGDDPPTSFKSHLPIPHTNCTTTEGAAPQIQIMPFKDETQMLVPPRFSSKAAMFVNFMEPKARLPAIASPLLSRARPSNHSKQRKGSKSPPMKDFDPSPYPAVSTDTLAVIEDDAQLSPRRAVPEEIEALPTRFNKSQSIDTGPSGSPPKTLPHPPKHGAQRSRDSSLSRRRHSRKQSQSSRVHSKEMVSTSSIATVRNVIPARNMEQARGIAKKDTRRHPDAPQITRFRESIDLDPQRTSQRRSSICLYSQDFSLLSASKLFPKTQTRKTPRGEHVRAVKKHAMAQYEAIKEVDENKSVSPLAKVPDPLDQIPTVPGSRPTSRTSTRGASSTRHIPNRSLVSQILTTSGIMVVADARPTTPTLKNSTITPSTKAHPSASFQRENSIASLRQNQHRPKKPSQRNIRSHISMSAFAETAADTPPSSWDSRASNDDLAITESQTMDTPSMHYEIEQIREHAVMLVRNIDKFERILGLSTPMTRRSRSRDFPQQRQASRASFGTRFDHKGAVSSNGSFIAASDIGPGPTLAGDVPVDSSDDESATVAVPTGQRRRPSEAPRAANVDGMIDQMASIRQGHGVATAYPNPIKIERMEMQDEKGTGHEKKRSGSTLNIPNWGRILRPHR